jgi:hypothetical protein
LHIGRVGGRADRDGRIGEGRAAQRARQEARFGLGHERRGCGGGKRGQGGAQQ